MGEEQLYLICKGGAYYRANAEGYTRDQSEAGRYTLADAINHTHPNGSDGPRDGMSYIPAPTKTVTPMTANSSGSGALGPEIAEAVATALEQWQALPDDERNGERPFVMGFNAGWDARDDHTPGVIQHDRDAAADYYHSAGGSDSVCKAIREGEQDGWFRVTAFAEHRIANRGWKDISEAPQDGSGLLLIDMNAANPEASSGYWWDGVWSCIEPNSQVPANAIMWDSPTHWQYPPLAHALSTPPEAKPDQADIERQGVEMLARDMRRMRSAGTALAEAALYSVREYDGLHRLALAVSAWAKAVADEGDRGERFALSPSSDAVAGVDR